MILGIDRCLKLAQPALGMVGPLWAKRSYPSGLEARHRRPLNEPSRKGHLGPHR